MQKNMIESVKKAVLPTTLEEFENWEPNDGFKYEWNDGELIKFEGMKRKHLKLVRILNNLFFTTSGFKQGGQLICEQDVMLTGIQLRRPDLAYFSGEQIDNSDEGDEPIPAFTIEIISTHDQLNDVKRKLREYFKHGVKVAWLIYPEDKIVEVFTSFKNVKICTDDDVCSASPVMDDFEITVNQLFAIISE